MGNFDMSRAHALVWARAWAVRCPGGWILTCGVGGWEKKDAVAAVKSEEEAKEVATPICE